MGRSRVTRAAEGNGTRRRRVAGLSRFLVILFAIVSLAPALATNVSASPEASNNGLPVASQDGTSSLEFDVVRCPNDYDPNDPFGTCTAFGVPNVPVQITSVDQALAVDLTASTQQVSGSGPGRVTFQDLPAGDYQVTVGLPQEDGVRYSIYCGIAGGGTPLPPTPDDALTTTVSIPDATAVACDLYIVPTEVPQSSIDLFAFTCDAGSLPENGDRAFVDFEDACPTVAVAVEFSLSESNGTKTVQSTDDTGRTRFEFAAGASVRFWSGVPLAAEEWLFCSTGQGEPQEIEIDEQGVSTFANDTAIDQTCSWYLVEQPEATEAPTEEPSATEEPAATDEPTEAPVEGESTLDLFAYLCPAGALGDPDGAGFGDFQSACTDVSPGIEFHLNTGDESLVQATDGDGQTSFTFQPGNPVDFYAAVPLEADEYLFCSIDDGDAALVDMDEQGVAHFEIETAVARTCSWFLVEQAAQPTLEPTEEPTLEPTEQPDDGAGRPGAEFGWITVSPSVCPVDYTDDLVSVAFDDLVADCGLSAEGISFTFGLPGGDSVVRVSDGSTPLEFEDLNPGTYTLYSSVPLEAASERLFCTSDGGNRYEKEFDSTGVTTFSDLQTETIDCQWFVIPTNLRGDETGGSLEVHLSQCPAGYDGSTLFDDCHGNGLDGYDFTLEGESGTQSGSTEVTQVPGPGIVSFTSLTPDTYTLRGGPPGDFGTVKLFCTIQPDGSTADFSLDGATATVTVGENQHVLCDWYFIPDEQSGQTPTPTEEPQRAEILVTLFACPATTNGTYGGATLDTLAGDCTEKVNDVTFRLGHPDEAPLSAKTGSSGDGAVRFYDLLPGDLTMTPSLPSNLTSLAVFCTIDDGDPYQKALSNGGTTFVDVDGESIACSWFAVKDRTEPAPSPTGSITIREYLCDKDRSEIVDWDKECVAGASGASFTLTSAATGSSQTGTPNTRGVHVFSGLSDGYYALVQNEGAWCRAVADRVDGKSRVIVNGGGNTDVVIYQCGPVEGLPVTGTGTTIPNDGIGTTGEIGRNAAIAMGIAALPIALLGTWRRRPFSRSTAGLSHRQQGAQDSTRIHRRFR